jgi:diaminohydroxyphosphoribosylaminopyrimidine deaminase/5-amino-6-(5-phosphoribosylamino)uracil reductase
MRRALDLASLGLGKVSPNPMVGCVVVHEDLIIGEGWHQEFGGPHAEVNALNTIQNADLLKESTVYVNLEPCSHFGKTPPCTDLLISSKVGKVVIGSQDPNPKVAGNGIKNLRQHGIDVTEGILKNESKDLNRRFFVNQIKNRPYVVLKWAQTKDGFIAREDNSSKWISTQESRKIVHKWRAEEDAILVGRKTVDFDNPRLTVRDWDGRNPVRVVIDPDNSLPNNCHVKDGTVQTLIYNYEENTEFENLTYIVIVKRNDFINAVLFDLMHRGLGSILIEGGAQTLQSFINSGLWDEARVFTSQSEFEKGIPAPKLKIPAISSTASGGDILEIFKKD